MKFDFKVINQMNKQIILNNLKQMYKEDKNNKKMSI